MNNTYLLVHYISSFEVFLVKEYKIQLVYQSLLFYMASQFTSGDIIFTTLKNLIQHLLENNFRHEFSFFNGFTQTIQPLNGQNPLSVTSFLLMLPKFGTFLVLCGFWFYDLISQHKWLYVISFCPCPWIKDLRANITKYILQCWERSAKKKSDIRFRVIKKCSSLEQRFLIWLKPF